MTDRPAGSTGPTRHRFVAPPEPPGGGAAHEDVVIVGGGSVGLTLALALARSGVPSVVVERSDAVREGSRALGMSRRTMEVWEALGVAGPMLDVGVRWTSGRSFYRGAVVADFAMPTDPAVRHAPMLNTSQAAVDEILVAAIERTGIVDLRWQTELVGIDARPDDGAVLELDTPAGRYELHADRVVACDGGRSTVRSLLGLRLDGTTFDSRFVIVDIALDTAPTTTRVYRSTRRSTRSPRPDRRAAAHPGRHVVGARIDGLRGSGGPQSFGKVSRSRSGRNPWSIPHRTACVRLCTPSRRYSDWVWDLIELRLR